ncbi:hypothetical protein [Vibrio owensii]|uniref:hypothetical protein n=1 Tax=Vibrio owensii TaxID=696485 RepID=UPI0038CECEAF
MKKLKRQYRSYVKAQGDYLWDVHPSVRSGANKHFSNKQEKSYYFLHKVECCEYPIKLRAAEEDHWLTRGVITLHTYMTLLSVGSITRKDVTNTTNEYYQASPVRGLFVFRQFVH